MPGGLTSTAPFSWPLWPGGVESWLTRISAPSWPDSASIRVSRAGRLGARSGRRRRSTLAPDDQVRLDAAERCRRR